jgi:hypothetical protein
MINYDEWASKFVGRCWHKFEQSDTDYYYNVYYTCTKCGIEQIGNTNFHPTLDDRDYLELVRYAMKHEKWDEFIKPHCSVSYKVPIEWINLYTVQGKTFLESEFVMLLFDRELGTKAIYEFFSNEVGI